MEIIVEFPMTGINQRTEYVFSLVFTLVLIAAIIPGVMGVTAPVDLKSAGNFTILSKAAITDATPADSHITGNVGADPIGGASIGVTCAAVSPSIIYDNDGSYTGGGGGITTCRVTDPALLNAARLDMEAAYTDATTRSPPDYSYDGAHGGIGGLTLLPGLHTFSTAVTIATDVTLSGNSTDVWVFQIPGTFNIDANKNVILSNGAEAKNIFWVVAGATTLGAGSGFNGTILDATAVTLNNHAVLNGRALAQTAVSLSGNTMTIAPVASFTGTPTTGTAPLTVIFTDRSINSPTSWSWDFGDGNTTNATVQNPVHTYAAAGTYTVALTAANAGGSDTAIRTNYITVSPAPPVASFNGTPTTGNAPLTVIFTDSSTGSPTSWSWDFGDGNTTNATVQHPVHTYYSPGVYTVNLTVTNGYGTDTKSATDYVTVNPASLEITLFNMPVSLVLIPGETATNTDAGFYVNSSTNWQVTASDTDGTTGGYMTNYSASGSAYGLPATKLSQPFRVLDSTSAYVALPSGAESPVLLKTGAAEESSTAYPLGIRQAVTLTDPHLPGTYVYHITVTLTVGSI